MRKAILNVSLLMLLAGSMSTTFVGCKDYDDDITNINENADGLSKQLDALKTALEQYKSEAAAAGASAQQAIKDAADAAAKGDDALAAAKAAQAQADLAKQAAAQAKADAVAEMTKLLNEVDTKNAKAIAELASRIDGIESGLNNIDLTDINKTLGSQAEAIAQLNRDKQALETQINALNIFKASMESQLSVLEGKVNGLSTDMATVKNNIETLTGKLNALQTTVNELSGKVNVNSAKLTEIENELKALSAEITKQVNNQLSTIAGIMGKRLTSVTLIPDLYIGGIPTIEFQSAKYNAMVYNSSKGWTAGNKSFIVSNDETTATYRMNPGTVGMNDIVSSGIAYVSAEAKVRSRAGEVENDLIQVTKSNIDEFGRLTVNLKKSNTASLNNPKDGYIYTVSLKVPVAGKHLFEGEDAFSVYSEYTRLSEQYFQPELRFVSNSYLKDNVSAHMNDSVSIYKANMGKLIAQNVVYDETLDLDKLVDGWKYFGDDHSGDKEMTHAQLAEYGLDIFYHVATAPYYDDADDNTNQQVYAKIDGSTLTPVSATGKPGNESIIGRQPIICAVLYDTVNKQTVDVKYFKVLFTAKDMKDINVPFPGFAPENMGCDNMKVAITWKQFADLVLENYGDTGMSKTDFAKIYQVLSTEATKGALTCDILQDNTGGSTPIIEWTLDPDALSPVQPGQTITLTGKVTFYDPKGLHPNVVVTLTRTIVVPGKATLGEVHGDYWSNNILRIYPVPMKGEVCGQQRASYDTNILQDRIKPYVNGILSCATWDVDFVSASPYPGALLIEPQNGVKFGHWLMTTANQAKLDYIKYQIANDPAGIALVQKANNNNHYYDVQIKWQSNINGNTTKNAYTFATSTLRILQVLSVDAQTAKGVQDNSREQSLELAELVSMHDAYGNLVANVSGLPGEYYKFYDVQSVVFGNNVTVANTLEGERHQLGQYNDKLTVNVTSAGKFSYLNEGAPLVRDLYIFVPVTIKHRWGVLTTEVAVPVSKKL